MLCRNGVVVAVDEDEGAELVVGAGVEEVLVLVELVVALGRVT